MKEIFKHKKYLTVIGILLTLGIIQLLLPERQNNSETKPEDMLLEIINDSRFFSTDDVAKFIIGKDPSIQLIDVREPDEFNKFSLPGAINIPLKNILDNQWTDLLNQDIKKNIFYSNGTIYANQAWVLTKRLGFKQNYVMKGGLNEWVETIIRPTIPTETASKEEFARYEFRKGASAFFGGSSTGISTTSETIKTNDQNKTIGSPKKDKAKKSGGGGC